MGMRRMMGKGTKWGMGTKKRKRKKMRGFEEDGEENKIEDVEQVGKGNKWGMVKKKGKE